MEPYWPDWRQQKNLQQWNKPKKYPRHVVEATAKRELAAIRKILNQGASQASEDKKNNQARDNFSRAS